MNNLTTAAQIFEAVQKPDFDSGVYRDLTNEAYHSNPGVSNSGLTELNRSPLHYWHRYMNPAREKREPTPAMAFGTAIHAAILEPDRFMDEFVREPHPADFNGCLVSLDDYRAKAKELDIKGVSAAKKDDIKALIKAIDESVMFFDDCAKAVTEGKTVITADQMEACIQISRQLRSQKAAKTLFSMGVAETSIYWKDAETGVLCRCRPDFLGIGILDVKSTEDASPKAFQRSIWNYRYWVQMAFYIDGVKAATGDELPFVFAAWEKSAPYASAFYAGDRFMLEAGRKEYKRLLRVLANCLETGKWPGYSQQIETITLPLYAQKEIEEKNAA